MARCEAVHPTRGEQCGLPQGHYGSHGNGTRLPSWSDLERPPAETQQPITEGQMWGSESD